MAASIMRAFFKPHQNFNSLVLKTLGVCQETLYGSRVSLLYETPNRKTSFLTTVGADQLWKGVTSVSNAGKKRGRGRGVGRKVAKDLNRGQWLGSGKKNMVWPGLTAPVFRGREVVEQRELPPDESKQEAILKIRNSMSSLMPLRIHPLERGWAGNRLPGQSVGPPDPIGEEKFENFDCKVLEMRMVFTMKGNFGRTRRLRTLVVCGNKNGIAGFGVGKSIDGRVALKKAKNQAAQKLLYIYRFEDHTVFHDFFSEYHSTRLYVKKMPKGYGLSGHRVVKAICEMIGITDLKVILEKSTNPLSMVHAFFQGLQNQKTHQDLANEMGLHVVEFRPECGNFPKLVASPEKRSVRTRKEIPDNEITDYNEIIEEGKVEIERPKQVAFYKKLPSWQIRIKKTIHQRNFPHVRTRILAEHGAFKSFLTIREEERVKNIAKDATTK